MKFLCVVVLIFAIANAHPKKFKECAEKEGATEADFKTLHETGEASDPVKCTMKCVMLEKGSITEDGKLVEEKIMEMTPEAHKETMKQCTAVAGDNACDTAFLHHKCIKEKIPEMMHRRGPPPPKE